LPSAIYILQPGSVKTNAVLRPMLLGIYFFTVCVVVGRRINLAWYDGLGSVDKDAYVDSRVLMPEWLFKFLVYMFHTHQEKRLMLYMLFTFFFYCVTVIGISWIIGLVLFRDTDHLSQAYWYGLLLYCVGEFVVLVFASAYFCAKTIVQSAKKMQDYETGAFKEYLEEQGIDEQEGGTDKIVKMADHLSRHHNQ
jgi:hypothetical protein